MFFRSRSAATSASSVTGTAREEVKAKAPVTHTYRYCIVHKYRQNPYLMIESQTENYHAVYRLKIEFSQLDVFYKLREAHQSLEGLGYFLATLNQNDHVDLLYLLNKDPALKKIFLDMNYYKADRVLTSSEEQVKPNPELRAALLAFAKDKIPPEKISSAPKTADELMQMTPSEREQQKSIDKLMKKVRSYEALEMKGSDQVKNAANDDSLFIIDSELLKFEDEMLAAQFKAKSKLSIKPSSRELLSSVSTNGSFDSIPESSSEGSEEFAERFIASHAKKETAKENKQPARDEEPAQKGSNLSVLKPSPSGASFGADDPISPLAKMRRIGVTAVGGSSSSSTRRNDAYDDKASAGAKRKRKN